MKRVGISVAGAAVLLVWTGTSGAQAGTTAARTGPAYAVVDLGTLGGVSIGYAISDASPPVVAGWGTDRSGAGRAFVWTAESGIRAVVDLGGGQGAAYDVHASAGVVGSAMLADASWHAFRAVGSSVSDLGTLPVRKGVASSWAFDVNDRGQAVGMSNDRAVLFQNGQVVDLNTQVGKSSGWVLRRAMSINDTGWVVGYGTTQGSDHAFLLVPR